LQLVEEDKIKELNITEYVAVGLYKDTKIPASAFPAQYDFSVDLATASRRCTMICGSSRRSWTG
jgi:hypothetical protein